MLQDLSAMRRQQKIPFKKCDQCNGANRRRMAC
jgi:hypothetical protein